MATALRPDTRRVAEATPAAITAAFLFEAAVCAATARTGVEAGAAAGGALAAAASICGDTVDGAGGGNVSKKNKKNKKHQLAPPSTAALSHSLALAAGKVRWKLRGESNEKQRKRTFEFLFFFLLGAHFFDLHLFFSTPSSPPPPAVALLRRPAASRGLARALQPLRQCPRSGGKGRDRGEAALSVVPPAAAAGSGCCGSGNSGSSGSGSNNSSTSLVVFPPREEPLDRRHFFFQGAQHGRARRDVRVLRPGQEGQGLLHAGAGRGGRRGVAARRRRRRLRRLRRLEFFFSPRANIFRSFFVSLICIFHKSRQRRCIGIINEALSERKRKRRVGEREKRERERKRAKRLREKNERNENGNALAPFSFASSLLDFNQAFSLDFFAASGKRALSLFSRSSLPCAALVRRSLQSARDESLFPGTKKGKPKKRRGFSSPSRRRRFGLRGLCWSENEKERKRAPPPVLSLASFPSSTVPPHRLEWEKAAR